MLFECSERWIRKKIENDEIVFETSKLPNGRTKYKIPVNTLSEEIKDRYYESKLNKTGKKYCLNANRKQKKLEDYSEKEREIIVKWCDILEKWQTVREDFTKKSEADKYFVATLKIDYGEEFNVSIPTLYRKYSAYKNKDFDGLIDKRGKDKKGKSSIDKDVWDYFVYVYLDERRLPIMQCYELTKAWAKEYKPELYDSIPHYVTFKRRIESEIPKATEIYGRFGNKAFEDRASPYIKRIYDDLMPNEYWIADNHTIDVITQRDGCDMTHRLSLTAFIDARSGVMVGWNLTDNPCSQSTVLALRHAIKRFGIPTNVYFDNGSEFLTHDLAGRGHRTRKSQSLIKNPPAVFERLGMHMTNAIVKNAKAKPIERTFSTFKGTISRMFETFCGGNVLERPENLKVKLKHGNIICDSDFSHLVSDMIDNIYNVSAYGGDVKKDRGKKRIDVWNDNVKQIRYPESEEDLNLMLLRTTRPLTVGRNGVTLNISGVKLHYWDKDTWKLLNKKVYVRYDPEDLSYVRIYEEDTDRYIGTLPMSEETRIPFNATGEEIKIAQSKVKEVRRAIKDDFNNRITNLSPEKRISIIDMQIRRANQGRESFIIKHPTDIVRVSAKESEYKKAVGETHRKPITIFDINRNLKG